MRFLYVGLCVLLLSLSLSAQEAKEAASSEAKASELLRRTQAESGFGLRICVEMKFLSS